MGDSEATTPTSGIGIHARAGLSGKYITLAEQFKCFMLSDEMDDSTEQAFYLVGTSDEAIAYAASSQETNPFFFFLIY